MSGDDRRISTGKPPKRVVSAERKQILSLPPEDALKAILDSPHGAALVQAFPEEDLHLLIHDIGIEDALPLLSMASDPQWTYMLDMEVWQADRVEMASFTRWLNYLANADPDRLVGRFFDQHLEDMELYLYNNTEVAIREHDQDASEFGDDFFTLDDQFYIRFRGGLSASEPDSLSEEERKDFLLRFLQRLAAYDHVRYQSILLELSSIIPSETEEEMYRLRNVRLAEKGFLPFDEAIGIYQPLMPGDVERLGIKAGIGTLAEDTPFSIPFPPKELTQTGNVFTDALDRIETEESLLRIQAEIAGLSNQIISADKLKVSERGQLDNVVRKATGYVGIGLETLLAEGASIDLHRAAALVEKYPLAHIFRVGYGLAQKLKWRTKKWHEKSWPAIHGFSLGFWGEHWLGVLGGLLIEKPLFYDNYEAGVLYREFSDLADIRITETILNRIIAWDRILALMSISLPSAVAKGTLSFKNLVLTLWARHHLGLPNRLSPILLDEFKRLFDDLWSTRGSHPTASVSVKTSLLDWLSETAGLPQSKITSELGEVLDSLFEEIESEYGGVPREELNPKYSGLFLLENQTGD
jgi:hypothetical protein